MTSIDANEMLKRLYERLQDVKAENELLKVGMSEEPIAIIGIGCRFPGGVNSLAEFGNRLASTPDWVNQSPSERIFFRPDVEKHWRSSLVDDVEQFDADFFGISSREAAEIDPQQRLLLEVAYQALEDARYPAEQLRGRDIGVFVGMSSDDYQRLTILSGQKDSINPYNTLGTARSVAAGRISYFFDFNGPALQVDTACSSSLMSIHLACQSLRLNESSMALAGGVNLMLSPETYAMRDALGALSRTGKCHTFAEQADGYARGEGCGLVVLKKLRQALADRDNVHAVIYATSANHDGRSNGLTAPNGDAQKKLLISSLGKARLRIDDLDYFETHGTGTKLGDPIEVHAIGEVLAANRAKPLWLGSLKSQLGHPEAAAGVASLIKVTSLLAAEKLLPGREIECLNPLINWDRYNVQVVRQPVDWPRIPGKRRYAAINAFGFSGTNVNLILGDAPDRNERDEVELTNEGVLLLCVSGKSRTSYLKNLHSIQQEVGARKDLPAVLHSSCLHKDHFKYRHAFAFRNQDDLLKDLELAKTDLVLPAEQGRVALGFSGNIANVCDVFNWLYANVDAFREEVHAHCVGLPNRTVTELLKGNALAGGAEEAFVNIVTEYCLAKTYMAMGVHPQLLVCRGRGIVAAAAYAGGISIAKALTLLEREEHPFDGSEGHVISDGAADLGQIQLSVPIAFEENAGFSTSNTLSWHQIVCIAMNKHGDGNTKQVSVEHVLWLCDDDNVDAVVCKDSRTIFAFVQGIKRDERNYSHAFSAGLSQVYNAGVSIDFSKLYKVPRAAIGKPLPLYAFDKKYLWTQVASESDQCLNQNRNLYFHAQWDPYAPASRKAFGNLLLIGADPVRFDCKTLFVDKAKRAIFLASVESGSIRRALADFSGPVDVLDLRFWGQEPPAGFEYTDCMDCLESIVMSVNEVAESDNGRYHVIVSGRPEEGMSVPLRYAPIGGFMRSASHEYPSHVCSFSICDKHSLEELLVGLSCIEDYEHLFASNGMMYTQRVVACNDESNHIANAPRRSFDSGAIWIAGGLGGLGLDLAKKLAHAGAQQILLTGRRIELSLEHTLALAEIKALGTQVYIEALDITDDHAVSEMVSRFGADLPHVSDIVHAAGVSAFCIASELSRKKLDDICAAKICGAWNLHLASLRLNPRSFVLYSSVSSIWGSASLSHYSAANAFLDALAQLRMQLQLPASIVNWGPWAKVGMAARDAGKEVDPWGLIPLESEHLDDAINALFAPSGWSRIVCDLHIDRFQRALELRHKVPLLAPVFATTSNLAPPFPRTQAGSSTPFQHFGSKERLRLISDAVADHIASALGLAHSSSVSRDKPLHEMGVDSLMAIDVTKQLSQFFDCQLPDTLIFDQPTVSAMAYFISSTAYRADSQKDSGTNEEEALLDLLRNISSDLLDDIVDVD